MEEIFPSLFCLPAAPAGPNYLLRRPGGNILFATKGTEPGMVPAIRAAGPLAFILLGDRHHVSASTVAAAGLLGVKLSASAIEADALKSSGVEVGNRLAYQRTRLTADLEAIPCPGHTKGAFTYLWAHGARRYLFIGDTIVPVDGSWEYWVSPRSRATLRASLASLAGEAFDAILSNSFAAKPVAWVSLEPARRAAIFLSLDRALAA